MRSNRHKGTVLFVGRFSQHGFILTPLKKIFAFGHNGYYQLGLDNNTKQLFPVEIPYFKHLKNKVEFVTLGNEHSIWLMSCGKLLSAGWDNYGQTGLKKQVYAGTHTILPTEIDLSISDSRIVFMTSGYDNSFLVSMKGKGYSFGYNQDGCLGHNNEKTNDVNSISVLGEMFTPEGVLIQQIAAGNSRTVVLTTNGTVYGCGQMKGFQDGNSNRSYALSLLKLPDNVTFKKIECGIFSSYFLTTKGELYVTGLNSEAQLCLGHTKEVGKPILNPKLSGVIDFSCGYEHIVVKTKTGYLACGRNHDKECEGLFGLNEFGNGKVDRRGICKGRNIVQQTCSSNCSYFLCGDGTIYGCGNGRNGQFFDGIGETRSFEKIGEKKFIKKLKRELSVARGKLERVEYLIRGKSFLRSSISCGVVYSYH